MRISAGVSKFELIHSSMSKGALIWASAGSRSSSAITSGSSLRRMTFECTEKPARRSSASSRRTSPRLALPSEKSASRRRASVGSTLRASRQAASTSVPSVPISSFQAWMAASSSRSSPSSRRSSSPSSERSSSWMRASAWSFSRR